MYTGKHARLYKHKVHDGQAYIFYMDIRSTGKGYEEFIQQGMEEEGILYLRGRVSRIFRDGEKVVVWGADTLTGKKVEVSADMVVLATAIVSQKDTKDLARKLGITADEYGFLTEAERKLGLSKRMWKESILQAVPRGRRILPMQWPMPMPQRAKSRGCLQNTNSVRR